MASSRCAYANDEPLIWCEDPAKGDAGEFFPDVAADVLSWTCDASFASAVPLVALETTGSECSRKDLGFDVGRGSFVSCAAVPRPSRSCWFFDFVQIENCGPRRRAA
mmetsp:Transcript_11216/g.31065  ORF Transcript_11216/g.31065 Transcript_11216/m.31065 type:complete len:107 (-) Transcript_11216:787-1107(-)